MDYRELLARAPDGEIDLVISFLKHELPYFWLEYYERTMRQANVCFVDVGTFVYVYDHYTSLEGVNLPSDCVVEDRLVGAFGTSSKPVEKREAARMRGWVGPTQKHYGADRDKGHVFGRSFGGGGDGPGINLWVQTRSLNRGWSTQGKLFRKMERFCGANPGSFCFTRPHYGDQTSQPVAFEFGILLPDKTLWVEEFKN